MDGYVLYYPLPSTSPLLRLSPSSAPPSILGTRGKRRPYSFTLSYCVHDYDASGVIVGLVSLLSSSPHSSALTCRCPCALDYFHACIPLATMISISPSSVFPPIHHLSYGLACIRLYNIHVTPHSHDFSPSISSPSPQSITPPFRTPYSESHQLEESSSIAFHIVYITKLPLRHPISQSTRSFITYHLTSASAYGYPGVYTPLRMSLSSSILLVSYRLQYRTHSFNLHAYTFTL